MMIKKSSLHHWESIPIFSSRICQSLYDVKENPLELCAPLENRIQKANYSSNSTVRGAAESLNGSHRMGDGPIFAKTSAPDSLMSTY
jgi:hypothetical protein